MQSIQIATLTVGILLGSAFALIWRWMTTRLGRDTFWQDVAGFAGSLISADPPQPFFRQYGALLKALVVYVGKKLLALTAALAPIFLTVTLLAPSVESQLNQQARFLAVYTDQASSLEVAGHSYGLAPGTNQIALSFGLNVPGTVNTPVGRFALASLAAKCGLSSVWWQRWLLRSMGFEVQDVQDRPSVQYLTMIFRPSCDDDNLLWPYLNDLEFLLLAAISVSSIVCMAAIKLFK